jgi:hypothetical protein
MFCLAFAVWFTSGLVMVFVPFPSLGEQARQARSEVLDLAQVTVDPGQAMKLAGGGTELRLVASNGRSRYVVRNGNVQTVVDARDGAVFALLDAAAARRVASHFSGRPVRDVSGPLAYDQWVVHQKFDPWRPFFRADLGDAAHTSLYVSARTGEVMQQTTRWERGWNWIGSVPHWLYFTFLRQSFHAWDWTMWCIALAALAGASVGTFLGIYRTYQRISQKRPGWSPFKGLWRWHHGLGLTAAAFVLMWIFSGWLSMDHGRIFSRGVPDPDSVARYEGGPLQEVLSGISPDAFAGLQGSSEVIFSAVGGEPIVVGLGDSGRRVVRPGSHANDTLTATLPESLVGDALREVWPQAAVQPLDKKDELYRSADGLADDAMRFKLFQGGSTELYIDRATGRVLLEENTSRRAYAWSYFALHTTHFPGLSDHPTLRTTIQVSLLLLGLLFSVTGMMMGYKRLKISMPKRPRGQNELVRL